MGYSLVYLETERARQLLEDVLKDNKSWLICHAIYANVSMHSGFNSGNESLIEPAVERLLTTSRFADETPLVLHETLYGLTHAIQWRKKISKPIDDLKEQACVIAERLAEDPQYAIGLQSSAQFYDTIGESEKAIQLWSQLLDCGSEMTRWAATGALMRYQSTEELLTQIENRQNLSNDAWSRIAVGYLLADTPDRKIDAVNIFEEVISERPAIADRYVAIEILLLLGEREMAAQYAESWLIELASDDQLPDTKSEVSEEQLLALIATGDKPHSESTNRTKDIIVDHTLGLLAIAEGDRESAIAHLSRAIEPPYIMLDQYWAEAFLQRLQEDEHWPRENHKLELSR
jgi:tetratricopeptide (TPR) repeat protein